MISLFGVLIPALLLSVFGIWQIWRAACEPKHWRSRAWWLAVPFHLLWLPAWYGVLATASQHTGYNPEILKFNDFNSIWLLSALVIQILMVPVLWWRYKRGCLKAASHILAFVVTGCAAVWLSFWWAEWLYAPLYRWWWQPLLALVGIQSYETLYALNHASYSAGSVVSYLLAGIVFTCISGLCCLWIRKRIEKDNQ